MIQVGWGPPQTDAVSESLGKPKVRRANGPSLPPETGNLPVFQRRRTAGCGGLRSCDSGHSPRSLPRFPSCAGEFGPLQAHSASVCVALSAGLFPALEAHLLHCSSCPI